MDNNKNIVIGCKVKWESQAQGSWKEKEGKVIAIIQPNMDIKKYLPKDTKISRCMFDGRSQNERLLVEVMGGAKKSLKYYYAPRLSAVNVIK